MSDPHETLNSGVYQLIRDTRNDLSTIRFHSLLNDLYGNDGFIGTIGSAADTTGTGGALINITVPNANLISTTDGRSLTSLSTTVGAYAGCVFTVVSGTEVGRSTRIVSYDGANTLTVMKWTTRNNTTATASNLSGARFVVNGRPFNGMGAGYNPGSGKCDLIDSGSNQSALLPNRRSKLNSMGTGAANLGYDLYGMDESYDAPDFQNMFLACMPLDPSTSLILPSFHRPELYKYWAARTGNASTVPVRAMMRSVHDQVSGELWMPPLPWSVGSGNNYWTRYGDGPWDVDNDGDGIADSVWVDLGLPDCTTSDGLLYRPLFAFLVLDLDGRLNLNANGNSSHYDTSYTPTAIPLAGSASSATAYSGEGIGPAEIMLNGGLASPALTAAEYQAILTGNSNWPGRYGTNTDAQPGISGQIDKGAWPSLFGMPANFFTSGMFSANLFGRPLNLRGQLAFGLDSRGVPAYEVSSVADERIDSPYELDLSRNAPHGAVSGTNDAPFSVNEMELLLRPFDPDTPGLPPRLIKLAPGLMNARKSYTTASFSLPVPLNSISRATRVSNGGPYSSIADLLKARLVSSGLSSNAANAEIIKMLPTELIRGERFNLNRLFGDGIDNDGNNVVDDPAETSDVLAYPTATSSVNANVDYTNGAPSIPNSPLGARQLMARHLYCLAMLIKDPSVNIDFDGNTVNNSAAETARGLAQWAINVVDFRDADSIMTPFEYDPNPFNGWAPDGDLTTTSETERGVAWGLERPELLITETVAWHDRATEDRMDDSSMKNLAGGDTDFDQRFQPKGAAFIELYNPWVGQDKYPGELYVGVSGLPVLNLNRLSASGNSPIWRVLVVKDTSRESVAGASGQYYDPDTANPDLTPSSSANVERSIYFSNNFSGITNHGTPYYPSSSGLVSSVSPGGYAVIGSSGRPQGSTYVSTIGHQTSDPDGQDSNIGSTRRVVLSPSSNQVSVSSNTGGLSTSSTAAAIAIDSPRSFSVSEPVGGYSTAGYAVAAGQEGTYTPPLNTPLDTAAELKKNGTTQDYRTIHLQRLANPLIAWNQQTNPYITIDVSSMNLTAFNGASSATEPGVTSTATGNFVTMQRGRTETSNQRTLWRHELSALPTNQTTEGSHYSGYTLKHSLGYLNEQYGAYGSSFPNDSTGYTFPWLTWNNRPYVSGMDLLLVPRSKASRLAFDYTPLSASPVTDYNLTAFYQFESGNYGHLLNFFDSRVSGGAHWYRLLDYVGVPSRFTGVTEVLNPTTFGSGSAPAGFRVPNNLVSTMREPGRININTIIDQRVWQAIMGEHTGIEWNQVLSSRRGYGSVNTTMWLANTGTPTYFANPFRGAATGELVPLSALERVDVDATLLRSYPLSASGVAPHGTGSTTISTLPVMRTGSSSKFDQADRNPYFRYQRMNRLNNLVTTQSNVYAVWVTMGYFQINTGSPIIQGELWKDRGTSESHRAFYIIDRSIPVAFEPGQNHNVDDAILVRRILD